MAIEWNGDYLEIMVVEESVCICWQSMRSLGSMCVDSKGPCPLSRFVPRPLSAGVNRLSARRELSSTIRVRWPVPMSTSHVSYVRQSPV